MKFSISVSYIFSLAKSQVLTMENSTGGILVLREGSLYLCCEFLCALGLGREREKI